MRLLALYGLIIATVYCLIFFTGSHSATPKLGIDLQGGTRVTLTARTPDGKDPSQESLKQAQEIIERRVNGLGVSGSEVVIDGNNLVITVPGEDGSQARSLGQTARLFLRPVINARTGSAAPTTQAPAAGASGTTTPASAAPTTTAEPAPQNRPFPEEDPSSPAPTPSATTTAAPPTPTGHTSADAAAAEIQAAKAARQSTDVNALQATYATFQCPKHDPLAGNDDPKLPLITCSAEGTEVFLLGPAFVDGQDIADASSVFNQQQTRYEVSLSFKSAAGDTWSKFTAQNVGQRAAFVLDSQVVSAPTIQGAIPAGSPTSITGNFTNAEATQLANTLKYGSLPLSFSSSEAETVSATLGISSLKAGLLAGLIGLIAVLIYCLFYYRLLGVLTALSLVLSGIVVYGMIVLLGRSIGFTLDLAGIAGLIIGIGMTADSFVVFFERIKDEMREGRSFRSAVPRGWARARRTILSGNGVTFLAAAVLYVLAVGQVRGFAFTLGLSVTLDTIVVFLVTSPLVHLASTSPFWAKPSVNGLGAVQQVARERRSLATTGAKEL
ncbi:MAG: protein translocase subunit SecD [Nocardiaceae bacterium]|nr:protein translocase subunit SecD [Nocardiaceae bacterium]